MRMSIIGIAVVISGVLTACASSPPPAEPKAAPEAEAAATPLPFADVPLGELPFDAAEAEALVTKVEAAWLPPADDPLRNPSSMEDVLKILKLDQTNLFPPAVNLASKTKGLQARVLEAQIELAWDEAYTIMMEILARLSKHLDRYTMPMQMMGGLSKQQEAKLSRLLELIERISRVIELFQALSLDHVAKGKRLAGEVILEHPDNYLGYRLAADHDRMIAQWENCEKMMGKIEKHNPDSNGLVFLRGAVALQRDNDPETAASHYRQALSNDPDFVRAQAHLVMSRQDLAGMVEEMQKLKALNPNHQLVRWVHDAMEITYREAR